MKTSTICIIFFTLLAHGLSAQELVQVTDETLTVNSRTAMGGQTRNKVGVTLPEKAKGYIYRLSVFSKGKASVGNSLLNLLQEFGAGKISLAASFAQYAIKNNDNSAVDAFIFTNTYDVDNFNAKKDGQWAACKTLMNRTNCCFATEDCVGRELYFGFRNNNVMQGLDVRLEIVALVDNSADATNKYSYSISNSTGKEIKYAISADKVRWQQESLRNNYVQTYSFADREIYIKINTDNSKFVTYKLVPGERYKIVWNGRVGKWDVERY